MKRVGILQSNYVPWKGYFDMINMVDEFILYDCAQYTKKDWRNRNTLKNQQGVRWITIPVSHDSRCQRICDTQVVNTLWRRKHWQSICHWYSRAAFFKAYSSILEELYMANHDTYLSKINRLFIDAINSMLGITTKISQSTSYELIEGKTERIVHLCEQACADDFLVGPAARSYLDESLFEAEGITVSYMSYDGYTEYRQLFSPPFIHNVSILDLILNEGADGARRHMLSFRQNEGNGNRG